MLISSQRFYSLKLFLIFKFSQNSLLIIFSSFKLALNSITRFTDVPKTNVRIKPHCCQFFCLAPAQVPWLDGRNWTTAWVLEEIYFTSAKRIEKFKFVCLLAFSYESLLSFETGHFGKALECELEFRNSFGGGCVKAQLPKWEFHCFPSKFTGILLAKDKDERKWRHVTRPPFPSLFNDSIDYNHYTYVAGPREFVGRYFSGGKSRPYALARASYTCESFTRQVTNGAACPSQARAACSTGAGLALDF